MAQCSLEELFCDGEAPVLARTCDGHRQKGRKEGVLGESRGAEIRRKKDSLACFLHSPPQGSHLFLDQIDALWP